MRRILIPFGISAGMSTLYKTNNGISLYMTKTVT
jgi:hypothetical protein